MKHFLAMLILSGLAILLSCGGGGGGGSSIVTPPSGGTGGTPLLSITAPATLPGGIAGVPYTYTFTASGGVAPFSWSIISPPVSNVNISADGILTVSTWPGYEGFTQSVKVQVTDSASPKNSAVRSVVLDVLGLNVASLPSAALTVPYQYGELDAGGGVLPITWAVAGDLPPGMSLRDGSDTRTRFISGTPTQAGTYNFSISITDSGTPQRTQAINYSILVLAAPLKLSKQFLPVAVVGQPYSYSFAPQGGTQPFQWTFSSSSPLPPSLSFDTTTGLLSGTPTQGGYGSFSVNISDSSIPYQQQDSYSSYILVEPSALAAHNDTIATATTIYPGYYKASLSPYDSAGGPDQDYYQLTAQGGSTVQVTVSNYGSLPWMQGSPNSPLDPVLELVDSNGKRLTTCNDPLDDNPSSGSPIPQDLTPNGFDDPCMDWQGDGSDYQQLRNVLLTLRVPGDPSTNTTFYIHVFDWRGDARPDMWYVMNVSQQ